MPRAPSQIPPDAWRLAMAAGPVEGRALLEALGTAEAVARAGPADVASVVGQGAGHRIHAALRACDPHAEFEHMERLGLCGVLPQEPDWPPLLAAVHGAPLALWVRGGFAETDRFAVAVVGSRACTGYGLEQADRFAGWLAEQGFTVVSGGARGIDAAAHRSALRHGGRTIAVLAGGLGQPYPPEHAPLFDAIVEAGGCVCSEFPATFPSHAGLFPRRNRIISGLSLGTLLIEARHNSGALITGRLAAEEHGREVMAVPGRVDSPASMGCHRAIREGWASRVGRVAEVAQQLRASPMLVAAAVRAGGQAPEPTGTPEQQAVLHAIRERGVVDFDFIAERTGLDTARAMAAVTMLELAGVRLR
ncbi:MAG: DNA-processing protein DprA [Phycisphaerales bacterium]